MSDADTQMLERLKAAVRAETAPAHLAERVVRLSLLAYFGLALAGLAAASVWLLRAAPPADP